MTNEKGVAAIRAAIENPNVADAFDDEDRASARIAPAAALMEPLRGAVFISTGGEAFVDVERNGRRETMKLEDQKFAHYLRYQHLQETGALPAKAMIESAVDGLKAVAFFEGPTRSVFKRVGEFTDDEGRRALYLDLGDDDWRAVEIDAEGSRIVDRPPVRFWRPAGMKPLPEPENGGDIRELGRLLNFQSERDLIITASWALTALTPQDGYPALIITGEHGSAKSTCARILRGLIDPHVSELRSLPPAVDALFLAAHNSHLLGFDNVSGAVPTHVSDALCQIATGGATAARTHHTNSAETHHQAKNPVILNGIDGDIVDKADLASRSVMVQLKAIPADKRRTEKEIRAVFEEARPRILGALIDALVKGLQRYDSIQLKSPPRMADFAMWATACETQFWREGAFMEAYQHNIAKAQEDLIDGNPLASAFRDCFNEGDKLETTAMDLLNLLESAAEEGATRSKKWPANGQVLKRKMKRLASTLRSIGITYEDLPRAGKGRRRTMLIRRDSFSFSKNKEIAVFASASPEHEGAEAEKSFNDRGLSADQMADANADARADAIATDNLRPPLEADAADQADACPSAHPDECGLPNQLTNREKDRADAKTANPVRSLHTDTEGPTPAQRLILDALARGPEWATRVWLADRTGLSMQELKFNLGLLRASGHVEADGEGRTKLAGRD